MKRFSAEFDETLKTLWPHFDYEKRTSTNSKKMCNTEFKCFRILPLEEKPSVKSLPVSKRPSIKVNKNAFFTENKFNVNNDFKFTVNPSNLTGLKVPDPYPEIE